MKRKIIHLIIILFSVVFLSCGISTTTYAYTEEQKQQAKAWLSAHGYSPDMSGASQAYQDYLNGKFDEELGIATTEDASVQDTESTTEKVSTQETESAPQNQAEHDKGEAGIGEEDVRTVSDPDENDGQSQNEGQSENRRETGGINASDTSIGEKQPTGEEQPAGEKQLTDEMENTESAESDIQKESEEKVQTLSSSKESPALQTITLYQEENMDTYREAGMVIALSVLLTVVVERVLHLVQLSKK